MWLLAYVKEHNDPIDLLSRVRTGWRYYAVGTDLEDTPYWKEDFWESLKHAEKEQYGPLLYKQQWNTRWALARKLDIFTCENITVAMAT